VRKFVREGFFDGSIRDKRKRKRKRIVRVGERTSRSSPGRFAGLSPMSV
jgi:hypothetical protein